MDILILGLWLWVSMHMIPVAFPDVRTRLVTKLGEGPYKGLFALLIIASVTLIVLGWRSIEEPAQLYDIYSYGIVPALFLLMIGFVLMVAAKINCNFKRVIRHPQMTGFTLWAIAHLLINGDVRTTVLFGTMALWAVATIMLLNKRDGEFVRIPKQLPHKGVMATAIGFVVFIAAVAGHEYIAGVNLGF